MGMKRILGDSVMAIFQIHVRIRTRSGSAIGPGWGSDGSFDSELELPEDLRVHKCYRISDKIGVSHLTLT